MSAPPQATRLGLALSGGGHRAAFFHIGVLAKLAELGLLRKVEVISTVSGGSIVGALFYLRLKARLDEAPARNLTDADYFEIVGEVVDDYCGGAQKNLRARVMLSPIANFKYAFPNYTRTDRMGELYEGYFYRNAWGANEPIRMRDLKIDPGGGTGFEPSSGNPDRSAKVPVLLLNATTLNTGHNWRFTAQYMGEPAADDEEQSDVDKNIRLRLTEWGTFRIKSPWGIRRLAIDYNDFSLGAAVASSACFPIGFPPKALPRLYARKVEGEEAPVPVTVKLVDGGVHDNQGIEGLVDSDREHSRCTHMVISDASGQMQDVDMPSGRVPALLPRIVSIEGKVDREQRVLRAIESGRAGDNESGTSDCGRVAFLHLQTGLDAVAIPPLGITEDAVHERATEFRTGVQSRAQKLLSRVRTDLDAFTEVEALSLMLDGYRLAGATVSRERGIMALAVDGVPGRPVEGWRFEDVARQFDTLPEGYLRRLRVAEQRFFKPLRLAVAGLFNRQGHAASESAQRVTRRRWTERVAGALWLGVLAGLIAAGLALANGNTNAVVLYGVLLGMLAALVLYVFPSLPGLHLVSRAVYAVLLPLVLWPVLPVLAGLQLFSGWLHLRSGRVPELSPEERAVGTERAPGAPPISAPT